MLIYVSFDTLSLYIVRYFIRGSKMTNKEVIQAINTTIDEAMALYDTLAEDVQRKEFERMCELIWRMERLKDANNDTVH